MAAAPAVKPAKKARRAAPVRFLADLPPQAKTPKEFATDFMMGGISAAVAKTAAAPIERIKSVVDRHLHPLTRPGCWCRTRAR